MPVTKSTRDVRMPSMISNRGGDVCAEIYACSLLQDLRDYDWNEVVIMHGT